jgi:hypothetical protein
MAGDYMQIDPRILEHPKFVRAIRAGGSAVVHLWLGIRAWQELHDYEPLPLDLLDVVSGPRRGRKEALGCLTDARLCDLTDTTVSVHGLSEWVSAAGSVANRRREREKKRAFRAKRSAMSRGHEGTSEGRVPGTVPENVPARREEKRRDLPPQPSVVAPLPGDPQNPEPAESVSETPYELTPPPDPKPEPARRASGKKRASQGDDSTTDRKPAGTRSKPKLELPQDWTFKPGHIELAKRLGLDIESQANRFRDSAIANARRYADWDAAFRTWLNNAHEWRRPNNSRPLGSTQQMPSSWEPENVIEG